MRGKINILLTYIFLCLPLQGEGEGANFPPCPKITIDYSPPFSPDEWGGTGAVHLTVRSDSPLFRYTLELWNAQFGWETIVDWGFGHPKGVILDAFTLPMFNLSEIVRVRVDFVDPFPFWQMRAILMGF